MNKIIDKNPFEEEDFDIEYDEDFDDPSILTDEELIAWGVESNKIPEIRANWARKTESKAVETDVVDTVAEGAKEEVVEESNNKITFTYCTTNCDKKPDSYPRNSNEFKHNITKTGMQYDWWVSKTSTAEELFKLSASGYTVVTSVFEGNRKLKDNSGKFIQCEVVYLDSDDGIPVETRLEQFKSIGITVSFWYSTFSNTKDTPKYRIALLLDNPITTDDDYRQIVKYLASNLGFDKQATDPLRLFFGGTGGQYLSDTRNSLQALLNASIPIEKPMKVSKAKPSKQTVNSVNSKALKLLIDIAPLLDSHHPWRRLIVDKEWLYGNELYPIATSLVFIDGGKDFLDNWLESQDYTVSEIESKLNWLSHIADTQTKPIAFTHKPVNGKLHYHSKGNFDNKDSNCWDLVTLANTLSNLRFTQVGEIEYPLSPSSSGNSQDGKIVVKLQTTYRTYISTFENHDKISTSNKNTRDERDIPLTQLCVTGINDLVKQLREQSSERIERSVEEKLKEITTIECIKYDDLLELSLFRAFVDGSIATEQEPYSLHKELLFGLTALAKQITKDGVTKRTGSFIKELSKDIPQYKKRTAKTKFSKLVSDILKNEVNKAIGANRKKYSIAKCLPVNDNDGIYHAYHQLKLSRQIEAEKAKCIFTPDATVFDTVENNRAWLNSPEREIVNLPIGTTVIECDTGLGKGRWAINQIKNASEADKGSFVVCAPSHVLKDSIKTDWLEAGLVEGEDFITTPNLKDYLPISSSLYRSIEQDYQRGLYAEVKKKLRNIEPDNELYGSVQEYLEKDDAIKEFSGAILTTHARVFNAHTVRSDGTISDYFKGRDEIIIDEDATDMLFDVIDIQFNDIELTVSQIKAWKKASNNDDNYEKYHHTIAFLENILETGKQLRQDYTDSVVNNSSTIKKSLIPHYCELSDLKLFDPELLYSTVKEVKGIKSKVVDIGNKQIMLYTGRDDSISLGRIRPLNFNGKKVVITSATPNMEAIKGAFGAENVEYHQSNLTETKGKIFWVHTKQTSKSGMSESGKLGHRWKGIVKSTNTEVVVGCKTFKQEITELVQENRQTVLHYPTPGVNTVKGKSIACLGQYIENDYSILMKALLLGHRPETIAKNNISGFKTRDGRSYKAYTFVDEMLAKLDIYAYSSTIRQALGRARLIDNSVTAFFLSNKPIETCEEITLEQFFNMVKVSVEENTTKLKVNLNSTEKELFEDKYFGLRNEDGSLTEYGLKMYERFDNNRALVLQFVTNRLKRTV